MKLSTHHHGESKIIVTDKGTWFINQRGEVNPKDIPIIIKAVNEHDALTEALRSILIQDAGDLNDAAFRRYVCDIIVTKTLAKMEGGAE